MLAPLLLALPMFFGCEKPPIYNGITSVLVHNQTARGVTKTEMTGDKLAQATSCLYKTQEILPEEATDDFLSTIILLQVRDRLGDRMFELYTTENLKGDKGFYKNPCIYRIIHEN
ncbi:MAG TPA: hypothetical protein ENK18_10995 [Deltaproteobacteria bacterium]|nr:hypothetical protein [Deltaproteobacteria bacterium]